MTAARDFGEHAERRAKPLRRVDGLVFGEPQLVGEVVTVLLAKIAAQLSDLSEEPPPVSRTRR